MYTTSNGGKCDGEKKMSWKGYAGEGVRATLTASHGSRHLKEGRVWAMGIVGRRASQKERRGSAKVLK